MREPFVRDGRVVIEDPHIAEFGTDAPAGWDEICRCGPICDCGGDDWGQEYDDRCISCGAEIDHYLGCPDDPNPDYEAEAEVRGVRG